MKAFISLAAILLIFAGVSCQPRAAGLPQAPPPSTGTEAGAPAASNSTQVEIDVDSGQPDDPGMSRRHDKTLIQEEPSGDKSSRAAPNEGDAEPPQ